MGNGPVGSLKVSNKFDIHTVLDLAPVFVDIAQQRVLVFLPVQINNVLSTGHAFREIVGGCGTDFVD